jgi:hypothetical protein
VFEDNDEFYMVLETKSIGKIMLYRNQIWPDKWELVKVLLDNIKAVDPLVFKHEGLWWIICTIDSAGTGLEQSELHVFYSEDLLHGEWLAHPSNPVLIDSYYGRNAGFFEKDSKLFRCSQSYKNFRYGFQLNFHEILKLTPEVYQEELTKIPSIENCHTYSTTKSFTVIDYKS